MKRIFYDTETTGVRSEKDYIIEIAAYDQDEDRSFCSFVKPEIPIPPEASAIHHITDDMVQDAPGFSQVGKDLIEFCGPDAVLIAHNNDKFDKWFLHNEALRNEIIWPEGWLHLDSLIWARRYRPDLPRHSLQFLREVYQLPANNAHRALDDVIMLKEIFNFMVGDLTTAQIVELLSTKKKLTHMPFGKHRGVALDEVPKNYLSWLKSSGALDKPENEELKMALEEA